MFEFYRIVTDPDKHTQEIKKFQYEETPETEKLKERLEVERSRYEIHKVTYVDRYYHCNIVEDTYPISLSEAVFNEEDILVGYMPGNTLFLEPGESINTYKEVRGATSIESHTGIRKRY